MPSGRLPIALLAGLLVLSVWDVVHSPASHRAQAGETPRAKTARAGAKALVAGRGGDGVPAAVAAMRDAILEAVHSRRMVDLRVAVELNEIAPVIGDGSHQDAIEAFLAQSGDGDGGTLLAALGRILESEWVAVPGGRDIENNRIYVWPRLAETDPAARTAAEAAELARLVPPDELAAVEAAGRYNYWRIGIGADGTWHFLHR